MVDFNIDMLTKKLTMGDFFIFKHSMQHSTMNQLPCLALDP